MRDPNKLFSNPLGLHRGITAAAEQGYAFVPDGISAEGCMLLRQEVESLDLELGDHISNPIYQGTPKEITQMHERKYLPIGHPDVPVATMVTKALAVRIKARRFRYPELHHWMATEAGYQLYSGSDHHISKHRDRRNDQLLAATITIAGAARVGIHEAIADPDDYSKTKEVDKYGAEAGTIMFLRAPGLGSGEQVIHDVSPPIGDEPRLILNLRMRPDILPAPEQTGA